MIYCLSLSSLALFIQDNIPNLIQNIKRSTCEGEHVEQQYNHYKHKKDSPRQSRIPFKKLVHGQLHQDAFFISFKNVNKT